MAMRSGRPAQPISETLCSRLGSLARREFLIAAALGAAGLAGLARRMGLGALFAAEGEEATRLGVLARLGEIWRAMTKHASREVSDQPAFEALGGQMETVLGDLSTLSERGAFDADGAAALSAAFRERHAHIHRQRYVMATCYDMPTSSWRIQQSRQAVEEQVKTLNDLAAAGKLTPEAEAKAREVIAKQVAFQKQMRTMQKQAEGLTGEEARAVWQAMVELSERYGAGTIEATEASDATAKTLVALSVER